MEPRKPGTLGTDAVCSPSAMDPLRHGLCTGIRPGLRPQRADDLRGHGPFRTLLPARPRPVEGALAPACVLAQLAASLYVRTAARSNRVRATPHPLARNRRRGSTDSRPQQGPGPRAAAVVLVGDSAGEPAPAAAGSDEKRGCRRPNHAGPSTHIRTGSKPRAAGRGMHQRLPASLEQLPRRLRRRRPPSAGLREL
jgi:hypothetical protein